MINTTVSHYRVVEHLGGGGMGVVYKAEDTKLGRTVALKFLPPEWSRDPEARERFLREARAASALEDSRICTIFDIDETEDGQLFIAMAYYEGETLKKRLERGRLPIHEAVDIAIQVAEGLESAHAAEILHRDIKPANLMLTGHDEVVIVDFGVAKLAGEHGLTQTGAKVGTPHYMSPEQARGSDVGPQTDVWALGVVLYEMVTGKRPFLGDCGDAVVHSILQVEPAGLRKLRPDTPPMLERITKRALEKEAERRYASVDEFLSDLQALKATEDETGLMTTGIDTPNGMRRRLVAILGLIFIVVFAVALTWVLSRQSKLHATPDRLPRIVVLPFKNLGQPEDDFFAEGITQEITSRLSSVSKLQVISNRSAMYYKNRDTSVRTIGKELDVDYVLEGTIRWDRILEGRGRVRITPQLISVLEDSNLWSEQYDSVLDDIFEVQSSIAREVVNNLNVTLLDDEASGLDVVLTDVPEAYEAFLRGQSLHSGYSRENQLLAVGEFQSAVDLDPNFAEAWAALSFRHTMLVYSYFDPTDERKAAARAAAERSLDLKPNLPWGHLVMGLYYQLVEGDYDKALRHQAQALSFQPSFIEAQVVSAGVLRHLGRWAEAVEILEGAWDRSPKNFFIPFMLSNCYQYLGDLDNAVRNADLAISLAPENVDGHERKVSAFMYSGRFREAQIALDDFPADSPLKTIRSVDLDIASRKYESALSTLHESNTNAFALYFGEQRGRVLQAASECSAFYLLGLPDGTLSSCGRSLPVLEDSVDQYPLRFEYHASLGLVYAILGRKGEAIQETTMAVSLETDDAFELPLCLHQLALVYTIVGEHGLAIDTIHEILSMPSQHHPGWFRAHPYWDPLRDHPRFQALLEKYEGE